MQAISSRDNALVKHLHALAQSARERRQRGETLLDGAHLVEAARAAGRPLKALVVSESGLARAEHLRLLDAVAAEVPCYRFPDPLFRHVSPVDAPSGLLATIELPAPATPAPLVDSIVVLDGVQDPGNLGAIIRTADAMGASGILLGEGCADPFAPKPLRAAMGSVYHLPIWQGDLVKELARLKAQGFALVCGHLKGGDALVEPGERCALVIGSEGAGVSNEAAALCQTYKLPMYGFAESLNASVAAGILIYELARRMHGQT